MQQLIECVPNFSEGIDLSIITQITNEIEKIDGVRLLNVDPGKATNRTVVTFVGTPQAVIDAAFVAIKNGMHDSRGFAFFTKGIEEFAPKNNSHVKELHNSILGIFKLSS